MLCAPAVGTDSASSTAGRGSVRDSVATALSGPRGPCEEASMVADTAAGEGVDDAAPRRLRGAMTKKPSASRSAEALLQHPPSGNSSPASLSTSVASDDGTIARVVMVGEGPRAGPHTPAAGGGDATSAGDMPVDGIGGATSCATPCACTRSNQPASWSRPPPDGMNGRQRNQVSSRFTTACNRHRQFIATRNCRPGMTVSLIAGSAFPGPSGQSPQGTYP